LLKILRSLQSRIDLKFLHKLSFALVNGLPAASGIANNIVPNVRQNMVQKTNDPNDSSFDIQGIFNNLTGASTSGFNVPAILINLKALD